MARLLPETLTTINRNAAGCNSVSDVKANCVAIRTLRALSTDLTTTEAAGRVIFDVAANVPWEITQKVTDTWISSISPKTGSGNQQITIEYKENTDNMQRMAVLTLCCDRCRRRNGEYQPHPSGTSERRKSNSLQIRPIYPSMPLQEGLLLMWHCECALGTHPKSYGYLD